ncbi:hypothetical protein ABPG74_018696 [Tetrahymena malaccensis]
MQKKLEQLFGSLSCVLIILLCSDFKVWSIINTYAYSYLRQYNPSLQMNDVNEIFFWISFATNTGIQCGLYLAYKFGFRKMLIINGLICAIFVFASSFCTNFYAFTFTFAVGNVFFAGMIYLIAFDRAYKIFPTHKEITSGLLNVVFGIGLLGQGELYFLMINKDDSPLVEDQDYYPPEIANNLPWALRYISIIYASFVIISLICYRKNLFEEQILSSNDNDVLIDAESAPSSEGNSQINQNQEETEEHQECQSFREAFFSVSFVKVFCILFFLGSFGTMIIGNYRPYGQQFISSDSFLTLVGTISGLLNGFSGLVWGPILKKINYKYIIYILLSINAIASFCYPSISQYQGFFFFFTALSIFTYGGIYCVFPIMVLNIYGNKMGTRMIGNFYQALTLCSLFQYIFLKYESDWSVVFYTYGSMSLFGLVIALLFTPQRVNWKVKVPLSVQES